MLQNAFILMLTGLVVGLGRLLYKFWVLETILKAELALIQVFSFWG